MKPLFATNNSSLLHQKIEEEKKRYSQTLKDDQPFEVLKEIKNTIKLLVDQLNDNLVSDKSSFTSSQSYHPALTEK